MANMYDKRIANTQNDMTPDDIKLYQQAYDKLDINKALELFELKPHPGQQRVIDTVSDPKINELVLSAGRRNGKSLIVSGIAASRMLLPNASVVLFSKTFSNANNIFKEVYNMLAKTGIKVTSRNKTALNFTLENGSTFYSISEKNYDSILGSRVSTVIVDEAAIISQELLEEVITQNIAPAGSTYGINKHGIPYFESIMLSSPRSKSGYFYRQFQKGLSKKYPNIASIQAPTSDNPYVPSSFLEMKKKELPEDLYKTEYLGEFIDSDVSNVFFRFDRSKNTMSRAKMLELMDTGGEVISGIDLGYSDASSEVLVYISSDGYIFVFDEYARAKLDLESHVKNFKALEDKYPYTIQQRFIDPATKLSAVTMQASWNYSTIPGRNNIKESVDLINSLFATGKLFIAEECDILIQTLEELRWKEGLQGATHNRRPFQKLPKRLDHGDALAAMRYAIYSWDVYSGSMSSDVFVI